ncbi:MAG: hypothetical protein IKO85_00820 [Bacteroidaceae bacterium]|nr:hypothetical protein [Bacteroidaceae bacterium]
MMYLVDHHPFNMQPNRKRTEMADFCDHKVLRLLLTVQEDVNDVDTLFGILCQKADELNRKYPRQKPLKVEKHFNNRSGGYFTISVGPEEYTDKVGILNFIPVRAITNGRYFEELRGQI